MTYGNYNMMNMIGLNISQMFGGCNGYSNFDMSSFGNSIFSNCFGTGSFGNNIFTNCYGEVNYDKMAGYGVVNALFGVATQAIAANKANKQKEPDLETNKTELNKIANEISKKEIEITDKNTELNGLNGKLKTAQNSKESFEKELNALNLDGLKKAWENAYNEDKDSPATAAAKKAYEEANKEANELKKKIEEQDKIINTTEKTDIPACKSKIEQLEKEVNELEDKLKDLQETVDAQALKKSKSLGFQRADESCITKWSNKNSCNDDIADKKEIKSAIYKYKTATDKNEKRAAAKAIINMYESNKSEFKTKFGDVYVAVKHYLEDEK